MATDVLALKRIDHVRMFVGNARQSAYFYRNAFGFDVVAYAGLETGLRHEAAYVLRQGHITFVLASPLRADHPDAEAPLTSWYKAVRKARWRRFADIRAVFPSADQVGKDATSGEKKSVGQRFTFEAAGDDNAAGDDIERAQEQDEGNILGHFVDQGGPGRLPGAGLD